MSQNLSRFYQKKQKKNNALLSGIVSGRSKYAKTKKNPSEAGAATSSATAATSQRMETMEEFSNFEENLRSAQELEIIEPRAESPKVLIKPRAESPARFEIIESEPTSPVTAAAAEITSRPASKRRRTEEGSVGKHSDGNIRKNVK